MSSFSPAQHEWLSGQNQVVLITLRADGSPQSSNVIAQFDGAVFRVSVTSSRAKTHNLRRDPRCLAHVLGPNFWSYASVSCLADLGPITTTPGDGAGRDLLALYNAVSEKPHPAPDEFYAAMVAEKRLLLRLSPISISGNAA